MPGVFVWYRYERGYYHCSYFDKPEYRLDVSRGSEQDRQIVEWYVLGQPLTRIQAQDHSACLEKDHIVTAGGQPKVSV